MTLSERAITKRVVPDILALGFLAAVAIVALLVGWFSGPTRPLGFPLDDAWIHMVYGRNLATHGSFAYNDVATTGATSPLWAVFVALAHLVGSSDVDRTILVVYLLGIGFLLASVVLSYRLTISLTASRVAGVVAATLVATSGPFVMSAFCGMEVMLTAMLLLAAIDACIRLRWMRAGVVLSLASLARPEAAIVSAICFLFTARGCGLASRARIAALLRLSIPSLVVGGAVVLHSMWATGHPLPATFYMKQEASLSALPARLYVVVRGLLGDVPPFATGIAYLAFLGFVVPRTRSGEERAGRALLVGAAGSYVIANAILIQPNANVFYHLRYILPALPLMVVAAASGAHRLGHLLARRSSTLELLPLALLLAVGLLEALPTLSRHGARMHNDTRNINEVQRRLGTWIEEHTDPGTWIATGDAGAVRYFGQRPTVDVMGLNTPDFYWRRGWGAAHPVAAFVMIPCWFAPRNTASLRVAAKAKTDVYTVTTVGCMREQWVVTCMGANTVEMAFSGVRQFTLMCRPGLLHARENTGPGD